jgi:TonB family protein
MIKHPIAFLIGAAGLVFVSAQASAEDRLPTQKWVVEFADDDCVMSRQFGTEKDPLILAIRKYPMNNDSDMFILLGSKDKAFRSGKAALEFRPGQPKVEVSYDAYGLAAKDLRRVSIDLTEEQFEAMEQAGRVGIAIPGEVEGAFQLSSLPQVLKLGDRCAVELGEEWGFSAQEQARIRTPPKGDVLKVVSNDDYPADAIRNGEQGKVLARLTIEPTGKAVDCVVLQSSGSTSLDQTTCRLGMRRAHYSPAIDIDGKPVRGLVTISLRWVIP